MFSSSWRAVTMPKDHTCLLRTDPNAGLPTSRDNSSVQLSDCVVSGHLCLISAGRLLLSQPRVLIVLSTPLSLCIKSIFSNHDEHVRVWLQPVLLRASFKEAYCSDSSSSRETYTVQHPLRQHCKCVWGCLTHL